MLVGLGRAALASLLLAGCTGLNPQYADATSGEGESGPSATMHGTTGPDPSPPTNPSQTTVPSTNATLEPTHGASESTAEVGPGTSDTGTSSEESGGSTTGVAPGECSTYTQDCPAGDKCMPFADDGGGVWNAVRCFPLANNVGAVGDACLVQETATSGLDDCSETSMCWDVDTETGEGVCVPFCGGTPGSPECEPGRTCVQRNDGVIALCLPLCDPLIQACADGLGCYPDGDEFACVPDASEDVGEVGDPCEFINTCNPGSYCAPSGALVECDSPMCCASFCDLDEDTCGGASVCTPYFEEGTAPVGYENVGLCGVG